MSANRLNTLAIVQARMGSSRLPGKVMKKICDKTLIEILLERLSASSKVDKVILATTTNSNENEMVNCVEDLGYFVFRGSENDVLDRYYKAAKIFPAKYVVRITGDCPLIDPTLVDNTIEYIDKLKYDYVSNAMPPTYPDGLDVEVFTFHALEKSWKNAKTSVQREHVTPYMIESLEFKIGNCSNKDNFSDERWTVDEPEDLDLVRKIFDYFTPKLDFKWEDVMALKNENPAMFDVNKHIGRNEGAGLGTGQDLWVSAKRLIPGGNMLLSKRAEMFLPVKWPAYFSKAKGCMVWDMDNKKYVDMSIMGVGTNTLGYGHQLVDESVNSVIKLGNMSTLNCPEEVYLAEKLIELHPWSDMVRLARTGGEANSMAIRIARAASGKDKVAFCGYHGWHDWYLAANLSNDKTLDGHLLPGLEPNGVPRSLTGSVLTFNYNDFDGLNKLVEENDVGVIKMEVMRNEKPKDNFLTKVRDLATKKGIVLVFDEISSGFRQTYGGLHKEYKVNPDIAVFGKALGNGYAITAIIGRQEVMQSAQDSFISSTFWTERIGPAAALKTLEVMGEIKSWEIITNQGLELQKLLKQLGAKHNLNINCGILPAITDFSFDSEYGLEYKTYITQEMLKKGYLATTAMFMCIEHDNQALEKYIEALDPIFAKLKECENSDKIHELIDGPVCHGGFKRLN
ncbi:MAG: glutamate-1-semialdehyde aminotransferase [Candidatus Marinimicrobia bacterium]|nr:glutamate-1-semialdehyde aminotransferase [Candidatus Neomarinimicrobiota bacterium]|tara:strand:+ start:22702 stop:24744 length:2043 start_codon:yes stop_codon:yes gene_type:complete